MLEKLNAAFGGAEASAPHDDESRAGVACARAGADGAGTASAFALEARGLSCGYGQRAVLSGVDVQLAPGQVLALLGPNGVGKTTLFKTMLGFLPAQAGEVLIGGRAASSLSRREFAREVGYIPQLHAPAFSYSVRDVVLMGRTPHLSGLSSPGAADVSAADAAIERMGISRLANRDYASLSGGERQMVLIARALAQAPRVLVMDEPCASLDFGNQARLLEQVLEVAAGGMAVVMTTHDPNHAFLLDGDVLCLGRGGVASRGRAREVLTEDLMEELYGVPVAVDRVQSRGISSMACMPMVGFGKKGVRDGSR